jgi:hypothetical protein
MQREARMPVNCENRNKARIALGVAAVFVLFLLDTALAHHHNPGPASPDVWAALGLVAPLALATSVRCRPRLGQPPKA